MSSNVYARPLRLEWRESRWLARYTDLAHLLALSALLLPITWPRPLLWAVAGLICLSWFMQRRWFARRRRRRMGGHWVWQLDDVWVHEDEGRQRRWRIQAPAVVLPWVISLRLREESGRRRALLLFVDSVPTDTWRQLQVRLREWARLQGPDQGAG